MARVKPDTISADEKKQLLNEFWSLVCLLKGQEEIENFFRDLLSESEVLMLARRIRIAKFLLEGKTYDEIRDRMNTSYVTINNVHRWLQVEASGYKKAIPKLKEELKRQEKWAKKKMDEKSPFTFQRLKKRYPLHFLIFNLMDSFDKPKRTKKIQNS